MGILSGNPKDEPLHYGEACDIWQFSMAAIMGKSIREDVAALFAKYHTTKAAIGLKILRLTKEKGWLVPPPLHIKKPKKCRCDVQLQKRLSQNSNQNVHNPFALRSFRRRLTSAKAAFAGMMSAKTAFFSFISICSACRRISRQA